MKTKENLKVNESCISVVYDHMIQWIMCRINHMYTCVR
jgi:hypothetical protein